MPNSDPSEHPRVTLPKNLSESLKRLEDAELEMLLRDVIAEAKRRGVMKPLNTVAAPQTVPSAKFQARQSKSSGAPADLPAGKANLIKASHSTGMKPQQQLPGCSGSHNRSLTGSWTCRRSQKSNS